MQQFLNFGKLDCWRFALNAWVRALAEWPPRAFEQSIIPLYDSKHLNTCPWILLPGLALICILALRWRLLATSWRTFEAGSNLRLIVTACAGLLAWAHLTYPYDYFLGESRSLERALTVLLAMLIFWRPIFIIPYLFLPIMIHYGEPVMVHNWSVTEMPIRILILFCTQQLVWLAYPKSRWQGAPFVFMLLCIVAGNYFPSGLAKLRMGWHFEDHVYFLLSSMYPEGWLGFLRAEALSKLTFYLSHFNWVFKTGTLLVEFGAIFLLWRRQSVLLFLIGMVILHTSIFITSGVCFWAWVTLELLLIWIFWKNQALSRIVAGFTPWHFLASVVFIGCAAIWLRPSIYVWGDARANYSYIFEAEDVKGAKSQLPQYYFWPQYFEFSLSSFHYIHERKTLPISWGTASPALAQKLATFRHKEQVLDLEQSQGKSYYNGKRKERLTNFLREFIQDRQFDLPMNPWLRALSAPPQRVTFTPNNAYKGELPIVKITIYQLLSFYDGRHYQEIRKVPVLSIDLSKANETR